MVWEQGFMFPMVLSQGITCKESFIRLEEAPIVKWPRGEWWLARLAPLVGLAKVMNIFIGAKVNICVYVVACCVLFFLSQI